ncbi:MAG: 2-oxoglutarate oxidoreductase [Nitrososphaera sp.]|nr:MAG: 2-oxoglutarate oxidoreductase [Nitrososphaera sp.]
MMEAVRISSIRQGMPTPYCPGCEHGILLKLIARALEELGLAERAVMVGSVGCSSLAYEFLDVDYVQAPHGRAPALMTAIKLLEPNLTVFSVQGDGDAGGIGIGELISAANRDVPITVLMYDNMVFGMTGGQMSPTTPMGMTTTTTPRGRGRGAEGPPVDICDVLSSLEGPAYLRRVIIAPKPIKRGENLSYSFKPVMDSYRAILSAFRAQMKGGFSFVEFMGTCNVNWKMTVDDAKVYTHEVVSKVRPPRLCRDRLGVDT